MKAKFIALQKVVTPALFLLAIVLLIWQLQVSQLHFANGVLWIIACLLIGFSSFFYQWRDYEKFSSLENIFDTPASPPTRLPIFSIRRSRGFREGVIFGLLFSALAILGMDSPFGLRLLPFTSDEANTQSVMIWMALVFFIVGYFLDGLLRLVGGLLDVALVSQHPLAKVFVNIVIVYGLVFSAVTSVALFGSHPFLLSIVVGRFLASFMMAGVIENRWATGLRLSAIYSFIVLPIIVFLTSGVIAL